MISPMTEGQKRVPFVLNVRPQLTRVLEIFIRFKAPSS